MLDDAAVKDQDVRSQTVRLLTMFPRGLWESSKTVSSRLQIPGLCPTTSDAGHLNPRMHSLPSVNLSPIVVRSKKENLGSFRALVMFGTRGKTFSEQSSKIGERLDIMKVLRMGKVIQISLINRTKMNAGGKRCPRHLQQARDRPKRIRHQMATAS